MKSRGKPSVAEQNDVLLEIGKEGTEGIKNFVEFKKDEAAKQAEQEALIVEEIEGKRKRKIDYNRFLADLLEREISTLIIPIGWRVNIGCTEIGVIMEVQSPEGTAYQGAFKTTGDGKLDLNAVHTYALRTEDTFYRMKQDGIIT